MKATQIYLDKLMNKLTLDIRIRVTRRMKVRMIIAKTLLRLAATVLGCDIEFEGVKHHVERG